MHQKGCDTSNFLLLVGPPLIRGLTPNILESYRGNILNLMIVFGFHIKMHQKGCDTSNFLLLVGPPPDLTI